VAGIHFFAADPWDAVAAKALRTNLSDLAAKGAEPWVYFLALGLPPDWTEAEIAALTTGLAADQARYGITLAGGDTVRAPGGLTLSITALGLVPAGQMVRRGTARAGDILVVSGTIGDAALGLEARRRALAGKTLDADEAALGARYLLPLPRTALAPALRRHASAAMDVSDGLMLDTRRMADVSGVAIVIERASVPLSAPARIRIDADPTAWSTVLTGGDDYEILATVPPDRLDALLADARDAGCAMTAIGRVLRANEAAPDGDRVALIDPDGAPITLTAGGFQHF
jgi:thiamine-monophosphate kinase